MSRRRVRSWCLVAALLAVALSGNAEQRTPAVPVDPAAGIIEALKTHQVVAFGDVHGNRQLDEVRLRLLRDPRLSEVVRDLVVEFAAPAPQHVLDDYVAGRDVPRDELQRFWVDSSSANAVGPMSRVFFDLVREVNLGLLANRRFRVLIDNPSPRSMRAEADIIRREVIDKGRNALLFFGGMHFLRKPLFFPVSDRKFAEFMFAHPDSVSTVAHLEATGISVFSVYASTSDEFVRLQPDIAAWSLPTLTLVKGAVLGAEPFSTFAPKDTGIWVPDGSPEKGHTEHVIPDPIRSGLLEEQFDAVLLLSSAAAPADPLRVPRDE